MEVRVPALCVRKIWDAVRWYDLPKWERWQEGCGATQLTLTRHSSSCPLHPKAHPSAVCIDPRQRNRLLRQSGEDSKTSHASKQKLLQHEIWENWEYSWLICFGFLKSDSSFLLGLLLHRHFNKAQHHYPQFKKYSIKLMNDYISFESCISIAGTFFFNIGILCDRHE